MVRAFAAADILGADLEPLQNDSMLRLLLDGQTELVSLAGQDGTLVFVNAAYARFFGRPAVNFVGQELLEDLRSAEKASLQSCLRVALSTGLAQSGEVRMPSGNGTEHWFEWSHCVLTYSDSTLIHSVGRDVTGQRREANEVREAKSFLEKVARVSGVGGWQLDVRTWELKWSAETHRIHDVDMQYRPTLANAMNFFCAPDRQLLDAAVREGIETGDPWCLDLPLVTNAGRHIWVRMHGEAERLDGRVVRLAGAIQEITQRKRLEQELQGNEAFIRKITDSLPLRIAYVDHELRYRFANQAHCDRFARPRQDVIGHTREELIGHPTPAAINARIQAVLDGQAQRFEYEEVAADGTHRIEVQLVPDIGPDGQKRGYFYTGLDITDRSRAEIALRALTLEAQRQSDVLRLVTEAIPATVVVVGIDGKYRFANGSFEALCGLPRDEIIGRDATEVLGAEEVARRRPFMARAMAGESVTFTLDQAGPTGVKWREFTCIPLRLSGGAVDGLVGISQDITSQMNERKRLTELSLRDPLTGLLNRAGFDRAFAKMSSFSVPPSVGLLYIDLDWFKPINDVHGHLVGDRLLQSVAKRLGGLVRSTDSVARLGGDEFAILIVDVGSLSQAEQIAAKVVAAMTLPFEIDGRTLSIGSSVGVAFDAVFGNDLDLMAHADANLYRAKQSGRNRYCASTGS